MPFYAYRCTSCGHQEDVLQKISDEPLTLCPQCGQPHFAKQVTAAAFQLKGSGWYVTDFRNSNSGAKAKPTEGAPKQEANAGSPATDTSNTTSTSNNTSSSSGTDSASTSGASATPASSDNRNKT